MSQLAARTGNGGAIVVDGQDVPDDTPVTVAAKYLLELANAIRLGGIRDGIELAATQMARQSTPPERVTTQLTSVKRVVRDEAGHITGVIEETVLPPTTQPPTQKGPNR